MVEGLKVGHRLTRQMELVGMSEQEPVDSEEKRVERSDGLARLDC